MGRSGRQGAPGSGILILSQCPAEGIKPKDKDTDWSVAKFFSMKVERDREDGETQRIARLKEDSLSTVFQMECLQKFSKQYANLKNQMRNNEDAVIRLMCDSVLDQWALWLDETDTVKMFGFHIIKYLEASLINKLRLSKFPCDIDWMLPGRSVALAKYLAQKK
jgi:hypothetical protein